MGSEDNIIGKVGDCMLSTKLLIYCKRLKVQLYVRKTQPEVFFASKASADYVNTIIFHTG